MPNIAPRPLALQLAHNPPFPPTLPEPLRLRLVAYGIRSLAEWRALSRQQKSAFIGIVPSHVRLLNELSKAT
jgi:hypothetical protein